MTLRPTVRHLSVIGLLAAWISACGDDGTNPPPGGGGDAGPRDGAVTGGFDPSALATRIATANCSYYARCEPFRLQYLGQNEQSCTQELTTALNRGFTRIAPAVAAGRIRYTAAELDRCAMGIQNADCVLGGNNECDNLLVGTQAPNAPCFFDDECTGGAFCSSPTGLCGRCTAPAGNNQPCPDGVCGPGYQCFQIDQQGNTQCLTVQLGENAPCGTVQTGACRGYLQCVGDMNFTCRRPAARGMACDAMLTANADCNVFQGDVCTGGMCNAIMLAQSGMSCAADNAFCANNFYCPQQSMTCTALPQAGQACIGQNMDVCGPDAFCNNNGTCAPQKAPGSSCQLSAECAGDENLCVFTSSAPPMASCGTVTWRQCN